ncbi:Outer-membrane lipoprotein carrier protein [Bosea sp. 62]|uniref:LolA family protein n=1 Tax=unclassified Bosea (in: a-proteobacteria) TaxID=2653178 RepID=UPI001253FC4F|nr:MULTISPECIES: outer membrane lipoprotein carrier protein LolA [unclassified Bosea (in: a-proteobacteria)]CAD5283281.1 Outer-membrane lipoprotein carrier protein [Bosea sp. 21B]CAD5286033.1 Outer-membrane lipoprotein carrier protein [Bosea sp. 46]CAD5301841.1 Outer-membrane lipoprotein carrier protein [Bosea sp. 7B]VVT51783.1 Outer-membrane lipoprotein carrier protein [Bosea sp. EC-HK365B]VXB17711.1 Outer-membrane lipoprotein carrier protein [Bosea sp. 62]
MTSLSPMPALAAAALALALASGPVYAQPLDIKPSAQPPAPRTAQRAFPLPPIRPAGLGMPRSDAPAQPTATAPAPTPTQEPVLTANNEPRAASPAKSSKPSTPLSKAEAVERLNTYFNSFSTLQGDFIQFAADGRRFEGKLYIQRPGKMRFEYRPPVTMEVVADGTSVAIRDRKLATQDLYSIGQTPLKFLLKEQMNLEKDSTVTGVSTKGDILSLKLEDRSTLGGTSKITLNFDLAANALRQWVVIDPQGYETSVSVYNLDTQRRPDQKNFVINYERVL